MAPRPSSPFAAAAVSALLATFLGGCAPAGRPAVPSAVEPAGDERPRPAEESAVARAPEPLSEGEIPSASTGPGSSSVGRPGGVESAADVPASDAGGERAAGLEEPSPRHPLEDGRKPVKSGALPALTLRSVGMHVGGGRNTPDEKKPLLTALEKRTSAFLRCYRFVSAPGQAGTFGVDLYIPTSGGSPTVKKTRHKLGGFEFEACMQRAFEAAQFPAQTRPTTVSYSLRFEIDRR